LAFKLYPFKSMLKIQTRLLYFDLLRDTKAALLLLVINVNEFE